MSRRCRTPMGPSALLTAMVMGGATQIRRGAGATAATRQSTLTRHSTDHSRWPTPMPGLTVRPRAVVSAITGSCATTVRAPGPVWGTTRSMQPIAQPSVVYTAPRAASVERLPAAAKCHFTHRLPNSTLRSMITTTRGSIWATTTPRTSAALRIRSPGLRPPGEPPLRTCHTNATWCAVMWAPCRHATCCHSKYRQ